MAPVSEDNSEINMRDVSLRPQIRKNEIKEKENENIMFCLKKFVLRSLPCNDSFYSARKVRGTPFMSRNFFLWISLSWIFYFLVC